MSERRTTGGQIKVGDMIVRVGKMQLDSRVVEIQMIDKGTKLAGPRGGRRVLRAAGEQAGARALILANGRKPVVYADTTVVIDRDMEW